MMGRRGRTGKKLNVATEKNIVCGCCSAVSVKGDTNFCEELVEDILIQHKPTEEKHIYVCGQCSIKNGELCSKIRNELMEVLGINARMKELDLGKLSMEEVISITRRADEEVNCAMKKKKSENVGFH